MNTINSPCFPFQKFFFVFLVSSFTMYSCINEEVCEDITSVAVRIGFHQSTNGEASPMTIDSLTVYGLGNDSILYDNRANVGRIELPLDSSRDSCAFVFIFPAENYDTVWFYYTRRPILSSLECGFVHNYDLENINHTGHNIENAQINQTSITHSLNEHVQIFPAAATTDD